MRTQLSASVLLTEMASFWKATAKAQKAPSAGAATTKGRFCKQQKEDGSRSAWEKIQDERNPNFSVSYVRLIKAAHMETNIKMLPLNFKLRLGVARHQVWKISGLFTAGL